MDYKKIKTEHQNIPVANLVYGDTEGSSREMRLEAFVSQVKQYHSRSLRVI